MRVSTIIPTLNAEAVLAPLLDSLIAQTVDTEIIVIDSSSDDQTARIARAYGNRVRLFIIPRASFDHGATRDFALRRAKGDFVCLLTQDCLPSGSDSLERLLAPFEDPRVAAVFGRQIAPDGMPAYERHTRAYNYPATSCVWREHDIADRGVKAYFFSNSFAAYRRDAYESVGGFDAPVASNEDMLMAAKLLHAGYSLAYAADAKAYHAHHHRLREEYLRHRTSGYVMCQYQDRLQGGDNTSSEGLHMVQSVCRGLLDSDDVSQVPVFLAHAAIRFVGNRMGTLAAKRDMRRQA